MVEPPLQFETERLCLRSVQPSDGHLLFELYGKDEEACRYMAFKREDSVDSVQRFVDNVRAFRLGQASEVRDFCWVIELKDGTPIGSCGFGPDREFSLGGGYILAKPFWGKDMRPRR